MASIDKRPDGKWRARWREYPGGPQRTKHFDRKVDADRHLVKVQHDLLTGAYVDPAAARVTLRDYAATWLARMAPTWRAATVRGVDNSINKHVLPALGGKPIGSIRRADIEAFCAALPLGASTVATVHQHLGQLLGAAVDDGLIVRNPALKARLPRKDGKKAQPVPLEVVSEIEANLPDWLRVAVPLGVGVGLRQSEMGGLSVDRLNLLRRTLRVDRQLNTRTLTLEPPKTASSHRTVPLATFVVDALAVHLAVHQREPDELVVLTADRRPIDSNRFGASWRSACKAAGVAGVRYHDLRHTFASILLSRGVSVKAVADWLGHASPVVTLTTYAHLMPADEEVARVVIDAALAPAAEDSLRTSEVAQGL